MRRTTRHAIAGLRGGVMRRSTRHAVAGLLAGALLTACGPPPPPAAPPPGGPGEPSLPATLEPEERAFLEEVHDCLHPRWAAFLEALNTTPQAPFTDLSLEAQVTLALDSDGRLTGAWLARSSGVSQLDLRAVETVMAAGPFPVPPSSFRSDDGYARITWRFRRGPEACSPVGATIAKERWAVARIVPRLAAQRRYREARARIDEALAQGGQSPAIVSTFLEALLRSFLHDDRHELRVIAALGLGVTGHAEGRRVLRELVSADGRTALRAVRALGQRPQPDDTGAILEALQRHDAEVSAEAAVVASRAGHLRDVLRILQRPLTGRDPVTRRRALQALSRLRDPRVVPLLVAVANDREMDLAARLYAVTALGAFRDADGARTLGRLARRCQDHQLKAAALMAVSRTGRLRTLTYRLALDGLLHADATVRGAAAVALVRVHERPGEWRGPLQRQLRRGDADLKVAAAAALGELGTRRARELLRQLCQDRSRAVREAAQQGLRRAGVGLPAEREVLLAEGSRGAAAGRGGAAAGRGGAAAGRGGAAPGSGGATRRAALLAALTSADLGAACRAARQLAGQASDRTVARAVTHRVTAGGDLKAATLAAAYLAGARFECPRPTASAPAGPLDGAAAARTPVAP